MHALSFKKAVAILDLILQGKSPKEIVYELKVTQPQVTEAKKMFPLFAGLTRKYSHDE